MKKIILLLTAISVIAFQACKKDEMTNPDNLSKTSSLKTESSKFNPNKIENMDEYLTEFMKNLKTTTRNAETMSVEDAQWHISACLNFQFCNANVEKTHIVYDTINTSINVNDGSISMNDINTSLQEITSEVVGIYNSSDLENKNILYIKPVIHENTTRSGNRITTVVATSGRDGAIGNYYFSDETIPLSLFPENTEYSWKTVAVDTLMYFINVFEPTKEDVPDRVYYVETLTRECRIDNGFSGRMFNVECDYSVDYKLNQQEMSFYLDSYLGLIVSLCPNDLTYISSEIVPWCGTAPYSRNSMVHNYIHHVMNINYGKKYYTSNPPIYQ